MRLPRFSRPKGPGFGLSSSFYLSALLSRAVLPTPREVANPKGEGGAVAGYLVPLRGDKSALDRPMGRGVYALSSPDKKTVLKLMVMNRDEAGFDPEPYVRSAMALETPAETMARLRGAWTLAQATFESHDPDVYPALDFVLDAMGHLGRLGEGVIADPLAERYRLPEELREHPRAHPLVDAREHIGIRATGANVDVSTRGLRKFDHPELEITAVGPDDVPLAARLLMEVAQSVLLGRAVTDGMRFGDGASEFEARVSADRRWEGVPAMELLPPTGVSAPQALRGFRF